jgi:DNA-binding MarR family transcriptional regulator
MSGTDAIRVGPGFSAEFPDAVASSAEAAANLIRAADDFLAEVQRRRSTVAPLSASAFQALAVIEGAGEPLPSHVIAERLIVSTASMTSLLDTLERRGLAVRLPHPTDRRKILVDVTNEGRHLVDQMLPVVHATATEAFSVLTEKQRQLLIELLTKLRRQVGPMTASKPVPPKPRRKPKHA